MTHLDRQRLILPLVMIAAIALACADREPDRDSPQPRSGPEIVWVDIAGELFELELALDPLTRYRGLGGRRFIAPQGGMLFASAVPAPQAMVMRDCPIAIDVAYLDIDGRVLSIHEMQPEPPRGENESRRDYERRLPRYPSGVPAVFAVETAGGRLAELGLEVGSQLVFDAEAVLERIRQSGL